MSPDVLVVGCGLSGAVIARRFAEERDKNVVIIDKRDHIGGNCYDYVDENGIRINKYGAHLFHTEEKRVWDYVNKYSEWTRWEHKVTALINNQYVPLPPNITTINMLCGQHIKDEEEANHWLSETQVQYTTLENGYEMATSRVGLELYDKIFKHYTYKQWGKYPEELDAEVLARIPVRNNFDDRYFSDRYQALPTHGYTKMFEEILNHRNITVILSCNYMDYKSKVSPDIITIFTGPIDDYFCSVGYPKLQYRSINFHIQQIKNIKFYQPTSVVNYPGPDISFTRTVEYKHFLNQDSPHSTIVSETTCDDGEPYYPVPNQRNKELYDKYKALAEQQKHIHFVGRLASYKYFNMDKAILNALEYFDNHFKDC